MPAFDNIGVHEVLRICGTPHYFTDYGSFHMPKTSIMQLSTLLILFLSYVSQTMGSELYLLYSKLLLTNLRTCSAFDTTCNILTGSLKPSIFTTRLWTIFTTRLLITDKVVWFVCFSLLLFSFLNLWTRITLVIL